MSAPQYSQFTERMYARLPEVMREADSLNDYALKRYISAIGDVEDQVERLIARFSYLSKQDRLSLDMLSDDYNYYDLDWRYFQSTDSKNSAVITSKGVPAFLRTLESYRVVPNTTLYTGSVFRTDVAEVTNSYGLRLWYYSASMDLLTFRDVSRNNGSAGPQWVVLNATDQVPSEAYYVRVSPFVNNGTALTSRVWVDDVYVRSHYEVTTTNNLVSSGHNFTMRTERDLIQYGDFDSIGEIMAAADAADAEALAMFDSAPNLLPMGNFETGTVEEIFSGSGNSSHLSVWDIINDPSKAYSGNRFARLARHAFVGNVSFPNVPVKAGHTLRVRVAARVDGGPLTSTGSIGWPMNWRRADGSSYNGAYTNGVYRNDLFTSKLTDQWQVFTSDNVVPDDMTEINPRFVRNSGQIPEDATFDFDSLTIQDITPALEMQAYAASLRAQAALPGWDRGPGTSFVEKALSGVPEVQAYRTWLSLGSTISAQPGYARQVVRGVEPSSTYSIATLMTRDANVPDTASVRITLTPDTGGPTVRTFSMADYDRNLPHLLSFTWNSPETVTNVIVNIEYVTDDMPARGLLINDVSVVRYNPALTQLGRFGTATTNAVSERANTEMFGSGDIRSRHWTRYATGSGPEEPLAPSDPDIAAGTSFIEGQWHQTRPGNTYTLRGEVNTDDTGAYADLILWYRMDGKGWGEKVLSRISTATMNMWGRFERTISIPSGATEFRVNLDVYRTNNVRQFDLRNLSMVPTTTRSWYGAGSRPFAFNALATRSLNFLSRGDLLHYTANIMVTGNPGYGRYGVRIYAGESQLVHETTVAPTVRNQFVPIVGAFQVPDSLLDLRAVFYVADPVPKHQAAYFLSELQIVHSSQQFVEDPQNLIRNGGFEFPTPLEGWEILSGREQVRRNLVPNPAGPSMTNTDGWRATSGDPVTIVQDSGRPVLKVIEGGTTDSIYLDPATNFTGIPVGSTVRFSADVRVTTDLPQMRLTVSAYSGAERTGGNTGWVAQAASDGWVRHRVEAVVTAAPTGSYFRALIWPATGSVPVGEGYMVRNVMVEINTDGAFFDRYTPSTALAQYTWDSATQSHVERRLAFSPPMNAQASMSVDAGYNLEDVPDRPADVPLGATSDLVDPRTANTEWLPWLAQFAGHNINHFATLEDARNAFSDTGSNFAAGTIGAIQNAVATVLTGSKTVRVFPMTSNLAQAGQATQWDVSIVTRTSESPDIAIMEDAVIKRNAKPAGVVFHFHKHQSTWDAVELANPTWDVWDTRDWTGIEESGLGS